MFLERVILADRSFKHGLLKQIVVNSGDYQVL